MKKFRWALTLAGVVAIGGLIARYYHSERNTDDYLDRRAFIEQDAQKKCSIAENRARAFKKRFPKSSNDTKTKDPEKTEWESVQSARRDCQSIQALLDSPLPIETYERDVERACGELKKRQDAFERRFPTEESQENNDVVLSSQEWKAMVEWEQACDTARADLDEAKAQLDHEKRPTGKTGKR